jgi:GntR family transcriptional regulator of arabinose operon
MVNTDDMSDQAVYTGKQQQIRQWILEAIRTGQIIPGDKLPSESELCGKIGVSRGSVRQAIATLVNEGWLRSQKGVGTFCIMKDRRLTMDIGLICYHSGSYIFPRIARGCDQIAHRRGFHILLNQSDYDIAREREILTKLRKRGVDGILIEPIFDGSSHSNVDLLEEIEAEGIPIVLLDNYFPDRGFTRIAMDDMAGGRLVASHLWERGHRRIGVAYGSGYLPKKLRRDGAARFLDEAGAGIPEEWSLACDEPVSTGKAFAALDAFLAGARAKGGDLPTAMICTSDEEAIELFKAAEARGLSIPADLSVISFDNSSLAELPGISLTSVDHPGQYMGELAVQVLLERVLNPGITCRTTSLIAPRLVERSSVVNIQRPRVDAE